MHSAITRRKERKDACGDKEKSSEVKEGSLRPHHIGGKKEGEPSEKI